MNLKMVFLGAQGKAAKSETMRNLVTGFSKVAIGVAPVCSLTESLSGDSNTFLFVVTQNAVDTLGLSSKPDAGPYLLAKSVAELNLRQAIRPNQCLVIEDTHEGMIAALRAGMNVLQITDENGAPPMEDIARAMAVRYEGKICFSETAELQETVYRDFLGYKPSL